MRQDDEYCRGQGPRYPDLSYVSCRYQVQNARNYRNWQNAQMMYKAQDPSLKNIGNPMFSRGIYTPLDRADFNCWLQQHNGFNYVFCGVRDKP